MKLVNLTQHPATPEQKAEGVVDLEGEDLVLLKKLLTFNSIPYRDEICERAEKLALLARKYSTGAAMIGGAPWLMGALEWELENYRILPYYAFSRREAVEVTNPDGTVTKTATFRHIGFMQGVGRPEDY